ncbi:hypothetical protein GOBAR_AA21139 [Gossypium barbadense]|uniref:Uncharacterized protein n=1 Tax=Gossypium barbadense TaxID=3634 RepID=A0A2P5X871_GOSBA|nr:hypothetical protein GOBAR_AA21139 [Gossypium barbadense]
MEIPPPPPKNSMKAKFKKIDKPTQWELRLGRDGKEDVVKLYEEDEEEINDEAREDDNFTSYQRNIENAFAIKRKPREGSIFRDLIDQA